MKKKLILAAMVATCVSALIGLTACSDPKNGKSAYDIYVETYISVNGSDVGVLSEKEWLESLKGEQGSQGNNGLSAYEIYKQYTTDNPVLSEAEWLESLKGEQGSQGNNGLSAYEIYKQYTKDDPVLSEAEWLESLKGEQGETGESFWESNPQGLAFYPQDDGTFAVGLGNALRLSEVVVPSTYLNKDVTAIVENGFKNGINLNELKLPESIREIGANAFDGCFKLQKIVYGEKEITPLDIISVNGKTTWEEEGLIIGDYAFANSSFMTVDLKDSHDNDTFVDLYINSWIKDSSLNLTAALNDVTDIITEKTLSYSSVRTHYSIDFKTYGLFKNIKVELTKNDGSVNNKITVNDVTPVAVSADEYNFAPLNASYPVLVFSLKINDITRQGQVPTYVYLERVAQYDWSKLPVGVQRLPYVNANKATAVSDFHGLRDGMSKYIKELYEINPESKFNLYVVDNYCELILQMLVSNQIPEDQWSATLLSDGAGTAEYLNSTFGIDNPMEKYNEMKDNWLEIKNFVFAKGSYDNEEVAAKIKYLAGSDRYSILARYPFIIAKEQANVTWIVNRLKAGENLTAINQKDPAFVNGILATVQQVYTNNLLAVLSTAEANSFKSLYKFNSDMFEEAEKQEKEVIMILGTSWNGENGNLYDNIKMLVDMYGTEKYVYYYKGHPGYPTSQYSGRQEYFATLAEEGYSIYELDNAIAAEIILFFNPSVYMAGYSTSTFDSVESQDKALLLFGSKAAFSAQTYAKYFDVFASVITDKTAYNGVSFDNDIKYYVIEFNNTAEYPAQVENYNKHEIATYNTTSKEIKYYKLNNDVYSEVDVNGEAVN